MFYSEQLLAKEGPLAHVWLAANLERKLTKQQLLSTDITETSEAIVTSSTLSNNEQVEPLALRLTGTLLYGIVKIYSRKAKYLMDDVSEALLRLKTALRSNNSITLPLSATLIHSVKQVTLQDTVTADDLLWQEPLRFDDEVAQDVNESFNTSIEIGRDAPLDIDELVEDDGLQLDFDLGDAGNDMSIELGRDLETTMADNEPVPDLSFGDEGPSPDFGEFNDLNLGDDALLSPQTPGSPLELVALPSERKRKTARFADSDVVRTAKRRLVIDDVIELTSSQIREQLQHPQNVMDSVVEEQTIDQRFNEVCKGPITSSFDIEPVVIPNDMINEDNDNFMQSFDLGQQDSELHADDIHLSALDIEGPTGDFDNFAEDVEEVQDLQYTQQGNDEIKAKIATHISETQTTTFSNVMEFSSLDEEIESPKRQATTCFFELLVMASLNKVKLQQDELFAEINIVSCL